MDEYTRIKTEHALAELQAFEYTKPKIRTLPPKNLYRYLEIDRIG